jgi:Beta protein
VTRKSLYVPVLRSHRAELNAMRDLQVDVRNVTAPLIEISRATAKKLDGASVKAVAKAVQELTGDYGGTELYLDLATLMYREDFRTIGFEIQRRLLALRSEVQLILRLGDLLQPERLQGFSELLRKNGAGFRVTPADYANVALSEMPTNLKRLGLGVSDVDLIVDCQVVEEGQSMKGTAAKLETGYTWRSITYIGGSFPRDLSRLQKNEQHELPRHEWRCFSHERYSHDRMIRYGDYTIQHPFQVDPPPKSLPSGSIRYASDTLWIVMRGEKLDNPTGPGFQQYIAQAQLLCERPEFQGAQFSAGDAYIEAMSRQTDRTGTPESWLQAGINHHLTFAARQIGFALAA